MIHSWQLLRLGRIISLALFFITLLLLSGMARAQDAFEDPDGKYTLTLPEGWLAIINKDSLTGKSDFQIIYHVRENGALKISSLDVEAQTGTMEVANKHENENLRFQPGYQKGRAENFVIGGGATPGVLLSYDFKTTSGQPMVGRNYFLRVNETTV